MISNTWLPVAPMPAGRLNHCVAAVRSNLYAVGGYNFPPPDYESGVLRYDSGADAWFNDTAAMSTTRDSFGCGAVGSVIYAVGGESGDYPFTKAAVEALDVSKPGGAWQPAPSMQQARQGHGVAVLGGVLYAAGGIAPNGTYLSSVEALDTTSASPSWRRVQDMLEARMYLGFAAHGGALYAVGGKGPGPDEYHPLILASVETFDARAGAWRALAPLPAARERLALVASAPGLYAWGGCPAKQPGTDDPCDTLLGTVLRFSPPADATALGNWTAVPSLPSPNAWMGAVALGDAIYSVGGGLSYGRNETFRLEVESAAGRAHT
jgi:N-acetylneuraminic acid mutarotase